MILDQLADYARLRVEKDKKAVPFSEIRRIAEAAALAAAQAPAAPTFGEPPRREPFAFEKALKKPGLSFICEVKKASPSKGIIAEDFPYLDIAAGYEQAGADCISVLTEPKWFLGSDQIFKEIRAEIGLPMIRKDFTVDAYQIYQARAMGADAVLLICALLPTEVIREYLSICDHLGMTALVEAHDEAEIASAAAAGARVIGVNNRNLKTFTVDFSNSRRLRQLVPEHALFVAESGVKGPEDIRALAGLGADGVLVGEALMRADDKKQTLAQFREAAHG